MDDYSIAIVINLRNKDDEQFNRITDLQNAIFNYQTRYENIYEKAYSIDQSYEPEIDNNIVENQPFKPGPKVIKKDQNENLKVVETKTQASNEPYINDSESIKDIVVTSIKVVNLEKQNQLTVWYSIKNNKSRKRAIGFVVGNAYFVGADGKETIIESPENWINTRNTILFQKTQIQN